jgi:hypothetical protein
MLARDLCNWLMASSTSQRIATHSAETRQCRRVITHSWIIGHVGGDTRCFSYGAAQVLPFGAIRIKLLDCMAGSANVEELGGCAVFLWVEHIGTGLGISVIYIYACENGLPLGTESEEDLATGFLFNNLAISRRACRRHAAY